MSHAKGGFDVTFGGVGGRGWRGIVPAITGEEVLRGGRVVAVFTCAIDFVAVGWGGWSTREGEGEEEKGCWEV